MSDKIYGDRDLMAMDEAGNHYFRHVDHMTRESLHSKSDIAAELGWRDMQIAALQQKLDAVLAENVALKGFFETGINASFEGCDFFGDHMQSRALELGLIREEIYCKDKHENLVFDAGNFEDGDTVYFINGTPATDAILNAVRAEAIEHAAEKAPWLYGDQMGRSVEAIPKEQLIKWASQLRTETDTTCSQYESRAGGKQ